MQSIVAQGRDREAHATSDRRILAHEVMVIGIEAKIGSLATVEVEVEDTMAAAAVVAAVVREVVAEVIIMGNIAIAEVVVAVVVVAMATAPPDDEAIPDRQCPNDDDIMEIAKTRRPVAALVYSD